MQIIKIKTPLTAEHDVIEYVKDWYKNRPNGQILPMMFSFTKEAVIISMLPDISDRKNGGRAHSILMARVVNFAYNAKFYVFATESWVVKSQNADEGEKWRGRLDEHPNRETRVTLAVCSKDKRELISYQIHKRLGLQEEARGEASGDFTTFLDFKVPDQAPELVIQRLREEAKKILLDNHRS